MMMGNEIVEKAISSLGKGFDLTSDFRLKFCKGETRLVAINGDQKRQLAIPSFGPFDNVSVDIKCDKGDRSRYQSDILDFNQMSEFLNQRCSVTGKVPSGLFHSLFHFESSSWAREAANTKYFGLDCYTNVLFDIHIDRYPLLLSSEVSDAVPPCWDPCALARFIEKYGTHVIVGLSIGGQDMVLVKQEKSSNLGPAELKKHLDELGDQLFTGSCSFTPHIGGEPSSTSHCEWLLTVPSKPDVVNFSFIPITSLLKNVAGKGFLSHAINLYLRHKPPMADLEYFLDFQTHKTWAPVFGDLPLAPTTNVPLLTSLLHVNLMGPKLYINTSQVVVEKRPVIGMRLHLEGMKGNRLAIHMQHLLNMPTMYHNKFQDTSIWRGSDEATEERYLESIQRQKLSYVCTSPVTHEPATSSTDQEEGVFIVTGAMLHFKKHGSKHVLHLRLLFTKLLGFMAVNKSWIQGASESLQKSSLLASMGLTISGSLEKEGQDPRGIVVDSSIYPVGPPESARTRKLMRVVDTSQVCRGPHDSPGYWIVTGAKLVLEGGKVGLSVEFSLLNRSR
ncbi:hypothetical protein V2J09_015119 [Rumex salicifolius]